MIFCSRQRLWPSSSLSATHTHRELHVQLTDDERRCPRQPRDLHAAVTSVATTSYASRLEGSLQIR